MTGIVSVAEAIIRPWDEELEKLPTDDGIPMETGKHRQEMQLLIDSLLPWLERRRQETGEECYAGGNMFVYFSRDQVKNLDYRGPDMFVAVDVPGHNRECWEVWKEGKPPDVVIELLSESTKEFDKTVKKAIYQDRLKAPEYFWYDPFHPEDFAGFALMDGVYEAIEPDEHGRLPSRVLGGLRLGRWQGRFAGFEEEWLRWYTSDGELLPTEAERQAERADRLERQLRELVRALGVEPDL